MIKIDCVADLHGEFPSLDGGDLLIVAGDFTGNERKRSYLKFFEWIEPLKYRKKIVIAGNHNMAIEEGAWNFFAADKFTFLEDSGIEFEGLKIWGTPWTKSFPGMNKYCSAFTMKTDYFLEKMWDQIPKDTDILITHSPAAYTLDMNRNGENCGSPSLMHRIRDLPNLKLHVHGHIHEGYGQEYATEMKDETAKGYLAVNCSIMNEYYDPVNKPIRISL